MLARSLTLKMRKKRVAGEIYPVPARTLYCDGLGAGDCDELVGRGIAGIASMFSVMEEVSVSNNFAAFRDRLRKWIDLRYNSHNKVQSSLFGSINSTLSPSLIASL